MKTPTLRDVLWEAQEGRCWICHERMNQFGHNHQRVATVDHLWPKAKFGSVGDVGTTLLAHRICNTKRGCPMPTDDEIRHLIAVYRRVPAWWLTMVGRDAARQATFARQYGIRSDICHALAGAA